MMLSDSMSAELSGSSLSLSNFFNKHAFSSEGEVLIGSQVDES